MRIALIQLGYDDREPVSDRVTRAADLVRAQAGHDLVVLPELWAPGGFSYKEWDKRAETVDGLIASAMSAAARDAGVTLHAGSIIERPAGGERGPEGKDLWNTSLVFAADGGAGRDLPQDPPFRLWTGRTVADGGRGRLVAGRCA